MNTGPHVSATATATATATSERGFLFHERLAVQARATPDAVALRHAGGELRFGELHARVERIASVLLARGIGAGCCVALQLERSPDYVACLLGVLQANAAVLPLPPSYPSARRREILAAARPQLLIDGGAGTSVADAPAGLARLGLDELRRACASCTVLPEFPPGVGSQPAFVLCSSGSTGTPKMIVRSHASFLHRLDWTWTTHPYTDGEVCCQKSHMTTTHAVYELFEPLLCAVPVVLVGDEAVRDVRGFLAMLHAEGVTRMLIVPSLLRALLELPGFVAPTLRVLVLMGEYVPAELAGRVLAAFPAPTCVYSIYGSTEASSTLLCDLRAELRPGAELPLGRPISPAVRAVVLDEALCPVAPGDTGVLHIGGPALFSGYFRDPEHTAAALVADPRGDGQLFDTRDRVRLGEDDSLQYVGRVDHTVKIRGFRVDLEEVERALQACPGVTHAAVVLVDAGRVSARLAGFYTPATLPAAELGAVLRERLPAYMLPAQLEATDALPLTPSGKVDRRELLARQAECSVEEGTGATFASATEEAVAVLWHEVLGHDRIRRDSGFFEVGGSSLSVFLLADRLRERFGMDRERLPETLVYERPVLADLAAHLDALARGERSAVPAADATLVTLRAAADATLEPVFLIASAGGTLGAYERLVKAVSTRRALVGVRDPFVWGARDPLAGFGAWVEGYVRAVVQRQPVGALRLVAYSSAGAFGWEIAERLRARGREVALLALIDPLGIDLRSKRRYGYWAMRARFMRPSFRRIVVAGGWLRAVWRRMLPAAGSARNADASGIPAQEFQRLAARAQRSRQHVLGFSLLLELNSGLPFALGDALAPEAESAAHLPALLERVKSVAPEIDSDTITRMLVQYSLQTGAQNAYRLPRCVAPVVLFEPDGPAHGLLRAQLLGSARRLRAKTLPVSWPVGRAHALDAAFSPRMRQHYLCMRDELFVRGLATELGRLLA